MKSRGYFIPCLFGDGYFGVAFVKTGDGWPSSDLTEWRGAIMNTFFIHLKFQSTRLHHLSAF